MPPRSAEETIKLDAFVITGTRFGDRTAVASPAPIEVIHADELKRGGYSELSQMLQAATPSFNFPRPAVTDGTDHIRPATLRGLAPDQVLVLVNGKRRHTSALVNVNGSVGRGAVSFDFNALPPSAIERVEVLRDGASAQYGSDAIAGVINIILRKDLGWGLDATYGTTSEGDGRDFNLSAHGGAALGRKGTLFATIYMRERSPTSRTAPDTRQQYFGRGLGTTLLPAAPNYGSGTGLTASSGTLDPREASIDRETHRYGDPRTRERGFFLNGELPLAGHIIYAFGGASNRHGESYAAWRRSADDRTVRALWPDGFLPAIQADIWDLSVGTGLKGRLGGGWNFDVSTTLGSNAFAYTAAQSNNVTLGAASPTSFYAGTLTYKQHTTNLDLTRDFRHSLATPLKLALGSEFRHEHYAIRPGAPDSYRDGGARILDGPASGTFGAPSAQGFAGFRPGDSGSHTRDAFAVYLDGEQTLATRWLVSASVRFERYSDFGSEVTAKFATRVQLAAGLALRAATSSGFRAPHLAQRWYSSTATTFIGGVPFENKTFPVSDPVARALGAQPLSPETSLHHSVGLVLQPSTTFTASMDLYQIEIDDRIALSSNFLGGPGSPFISYLNAQGLFGTTGGRYFTNAVNTRTRGADVQARYLWRTARVGRFTLAAGVNFNATNVTHARPTPPQLAAVGVTTPLFDLTERIRMEKGQPRDGINLSVAHELGDWSLFARTLRFGGIETVAFPSATPAQQAALLPGRDVYLVPTDPVSANRQVVQRLSPQWIADMDISYRVSRQVTVSVGANNLFDTRPEENIRSVAVSGIAFNGSDSGGIFPYSGASPAGFNGAFYYGKISWRH